MTWAFSPILWTEFVDDDSFSAIPIPSSIITKYDIVTVLAV
jgi:hypothetical protein